MLTSPNQLYTDTLHKTPKDREAVTLAKFFVELARKDMDLASDVIVTFIKEDRKRVTSGEISSQTIPNHIPTCFFKYYCNMISRIKNSWNYLMVYFQAIGF